jgi:hypothetical protein
MLGELAMASMVNRSGEVAEMAGPPGITEEEVLRVRDMLILRLDDAGWSHERIGLLLNRSRRLVNHVVNSVPPEALDDVRGLWP